MRTAPLRKVAFSMVSRSGTAGGLVRNIRENVGLSNITRLYLQIKVEYFEGLFRNFRVILHHIGRNPRIFYISNLL